MSLVEKGIIEMKESELLALLNKAAETGGFDAVTEVINAHCTFTDTLMVNYDVPNPVGQNMGSKKRIALAILLQSTKLDLLNWFGDYYHKDVREKPDGTDHENIRSIVKNWTADQNLSAFISFDTDKPIVLK